jgi:hypothetical protein
MQVSLLSDGMENRKHIQENPTLSTNKNIKCTLTIGTYPEQRCQNLKNNQGKTHIARVKPATNIYIPPCILVL